MMLMELYISNIMSAFTCCGDTQQSAPPKSESLRRTRRCAAPTVRHTSEGRALFPCLLFFPDWKAERRNGIGGFASAHWILVSFASQLVPSGVWCQVPYILHCRYQHSQTFIKKHISRWDYSANVVLAIRVETRINLKRSMS
jgi:hypothetical protein